MVEKVVRSDGNTSEPVNHDRVVVELAGGNVTIEMYDVELRPGELGPVVELNVGQNRILLRAGDWRLVVEALRRLLD